VVCMREVGLGNSLGTRPSSSQRQVSGAMLAKAAFAALGSTPQESPKCQPPSSCGK
jgi:hypothetical protein